jgi:hypothetical protein
MGPCGVLLLSLIGLNEEQISSLKVQLSAGLKDVEPWQVLYKEFVSVLPYTYLRDYTLVVTVSKGLPGEAEWFSVGGDIVGISYHAATISEALQAHILKKFSESTFEEIGT